VTGKLDMTVTNRSNDMLWGAYGANAVHFSYLQEFVAAAIGVPVGTYYQVSNNLHVYTQNEVFAKTCELLNRKNMLEVEAADAPLQPYPIFMGLDSHSADSWLQDCEEFVNNPGQTSLGLAQFFRRVAVPMWKTWEAYKEKEQRSRFFNAKGHAELIKDLAWRAAVEEWLDRRMTKIAGTK
jgi:hypothetical protein